MKKHDITWVTWEFKLELMLDVYANFRSKDLSLIKCEIGTLAMAHTVMPVNNQRVLQIILVSGKQGDLEPFFETTFAPARALGAITCLGKIYWVLHKNESTTDGAIRISDHVFTLLDLKVYSVNDILNYGLEKSNPRLEWTKNKLRSEFTVRKHTMFESNGVLVGIEEHLKKKHGLVN